MRRFWCGFHHKVYRRMMGRKPWQGKDGIWIYPLMEDIVVEVVLQEVDIYVSRH